MQRFLGSGFYFQPGVFLIKLDTQDRVSSIITSRDSFGYKNHKPDRQYKAVAIAPEASPGGGKELLFTPEEVASGTPLKTRLAKIVRTAAPSVYTVGDGGSHQDFYALYRNESPIFVGNAQPGPLSAKTKILDYHERKDKDKGLETEFATLDLQGDYIRYELASNGPSEIR